MAKITIDIPVGTVDGKPPVYNPDGRFDQWNLEDIWFGTEGEGKYVPNVNDLVFNMKTMEVFYVKSIDEVTLIPTLAKFDLKVKDAGVKEEDLLLGVGPGGVDQTFRLYIDKSVRPFVMAVDARCYLYGKDLRSYQIVTGSEVTGDIRVISANYDQSGNYLGTDVPLELANMRDHTNECTWSIPPCNTAQELKDNDVVYLRGFGADGGLRCKFPLLVENSSFIRLTDASYKYVTHISLESPFLSTHDTHIIEYPLNVPLSGLNLFGVVHYSDGSRRRMPVDGTKFEIFGFENFVATVVGEETRLLLKYNFSNDEYHYGSTVNDTKSLLESYRAISVKEDGSYTVKLFAYPIWVDELTGYRMEFFLFNLDRKTWSRVTPYVEYNSNLPAFRPTLYGVNQQISVSIDLAKVNTTYKHWIHTQVIDVVLYRAATDHSSTPWTISYERNQPTPFGRDNWCEVTMVDYDVKLLDITCGEVLLPNWLERLYWLTKPIHSTTRESKAPTPNMFSIITKHGEYEFPIKQWNSKLTINGLLENDETVFVRFFKRTTDIDLQLAMAALPVIYMNSIP